MLIDDGLSNKTLPTIILYTVTPRLTFTAPKVIISRQLRLYPGLGRTSVYFVAPMPDETLRLSTLHPVIWHPHPRIHTPSDLH